MLKKRKLATVAPSSDLPSLGSGLQHLPLCLNIFCLKPLIKE